jgi:hypothetical protein
MVGVMVRGDLIRLMDPHSSGNNPTAETMEKRLGKQKINVSTHAVQEMSEAMKRDGLVASYEGQSNRGYWLTPQGMVMKNELAVAVAKKETKLGQPQKKKRKR